MRNALAISAALALSAPAWGTETAGTPPSLETGVRVRLTANRSIRVPGVVDIDDGRISVHGGRVLARNARRILMEVPNGLTLFVPLSEEHLQGRIIALEADHFVVELREGAEIARIPRAAIATVDVSAGRSSRAGHALVGLLVGAALGAGVGAITGTGCSPSDWFCSPGFNAAALAIVCAPIGAVGGAVMPVERWKRVAEPSVRLGMVPVRGGAAVTLAVRF
jgi:hypothetical protein